MCLARCTALGLASELDARNKKNIQKHKYSGIRKHAISALLKRFNRASNRLNAFVLDVLRINRDFFYEKT